MGGGGGLISEPKDWFQGSGLNKESKLQQIQIQSSSVLMKSYKNPDPLLGGTDSMTPPPENQASESRIRVAVASHLGPLSCPPT